MAPARHKISNPINRTAVSTRLPLSRSSRLCRFSSFTRFFIFLLAIPFLVIVPGDDKSVPTNIAIQYIDKQQLNIYSYYLYTYMQREQDKAKQLCTWRLCFSFSV